MFRIGQGDFARMFKIDASEIPKLAKERLSSYDLTVRLANKTEFAEYVLNFLKLIDETRTYRSKEENLATFERGWTENLLKLKGAGPESLEAALKPGYFRGSKFFRYNTELVVTDNLQLEYELFVIARLCLTYTYLRSSTVVYELGCGSCANLLLLSKILPDAELVGLDWTKASSEIAGELKRKTARPISGHVFDLMEPDKSLTLPEGTALISIHAFEQLGGSFGPALDFILASKPSIVVQYEPVLEFYNGNNLLDYLSLSYCVKRNYLNGYYSKLLRLEKDRRIEILAAYRPYLGGVLHESSVLVWKPLGR